MGFRTVIRCLLVGVVVTMGIFAAPTSSSEACSGADACRVRGDRGKVSCKGTCPSAARPRCLLQFRRRGSVQAWRTDPENLRENDPREEYRCICRR